MPWDTVNCGGHGRLEAMEPARWEGSPFNI
jgi:hypothetical protein